MRYDDFPILDSNEYSFISEQYKATQPFNRKALSFEICQELTTCINSCCAIENLYNTKIRQAINETKQILNKQLSNFSSLFNIQTTKVQNISSFNIFTFIKKINNIISLLSDWLSGEEKEYYKKLSKKSILELLEVINKIYSALEESNIYFFKHM